MAVMETEMQAQPVKMHPLGVHLANNQDRELVPNLQRHGDLTGRLQIQVGIFITPINVFFFSRQGHFEFFRNRQSLGILEIFKI